MSDSINPTLAEAEAEYWAAIAVQVSAAQTAEAATAALDDASDRVARAARSRSAVGRRLPPEDN